MYEGRDLLNSDMFPCIAQKQTTIDKMQKSKNLKKDTRTVFKTSDEITHFLFH